VAPNWYAGNFQPARGVFHEYEVFGEVNVPLLDNTDWGRINANLAGRYTHYTTSKDVETWKVGMTWDTPLDGLRLRALQSRDVRAAQPGGTLRRRPRQQRLGHRSLSPAARAARGTRQTGPSARCPTPSPPTRT